MAARAQVTIFGSADDELLALDRNLLTCVLTFQNLQLQFHGSAPLRKGYQ
jgi:hypothetical protein